MKTAASTATPNTPPSSRSALFVPEAMPASVGGTDPITTLATVAKHIDVPVGEPAGERRPRK